MYPFIDRSQSDVVIQKLSELHQHESVPRMEIGHIGVDHNGDQPGGGQRLVTN